MKINLDEIDKLAKASTRGIWKADDNIVFCDGESVALDCRHTDASFIASMNPQTAMALIRVARLAKEINDEYKHDLGHFSPVLEEALKEIDA